ncbi:hypothetical protein DMC14_001010 [Metamycoplasma phocicerebrale]|uniref:Uncharacterized protein n=1 Tax=Metamycoplasma phocicerebrale TaxID=142649 RepID=A0A3T0TTL9_9BACT|nr:hypothetical protein [Metamycoplasma phocicerebrale]AZZ65373.1 hypothetical protein DMC14_001010 [Metamycoplasma phocicerebrale]
MNKKIHLTNFLLMIFISILVVIAGVLLYSLVIKGSSFTVDTKNIKLSTENFWNLMKSKGVAIASSIIALFSLAALLHIILFIYIIIGAVDGFKNNHYSVGVLYVLGAFIPMSIFTFIASCIGMSRGKKA